MTMTQYAKTALTVGISLLGLTVLQFGTSALAQSESSSEASSYAASEASSQASSQASAESTLSYGHTGYQVYQVFPPSFMWHTAAQLGYLPYDPFWAPPLFLPPDTPPARPWSTYPLAVAGTPIINGPRWVYLTPEQLGKLSQPTPMNLTPSPSTQTNNHYGMARVIPRSNADQKRFENKLAAAIIHNSYLSNRYPF